MADLPDQAPVLVGVSALQQKLPDHEQALEPIASFFPSAGACSEQVRLFIARVDSATAGGVHGCAQEGENILVHRLSRSAVMAELAAGRISNGHTLIALQWLQIHGAALRQRWT